MSVTIDKTRLEIEESRKRFDHDMEESRKRFDLDMEDARRRWNKHVEDRELADKKLELENKRFKIQVWTTVIAAIAAGGGYLTWWTIHIPH